MFVWLVIFASLTDVVVGGGGWSGVDSFVVGGRGFIKTALLGL